MFTLWRLPLSLVETALDQKVLPTLEKVEFEFSQFSKGDNIDPSPSCLSRTIAVSEADLYYHGSGADPMGSLNGSIPAGIGLRKIHLDDIDGEVGSPLFP